MTLAACSALVEQGDPERFAATMAAPVAARAVLIPLYAFNLEVARAAWASREPMIAEMRLQWWRDALVEIGDGGVVSTHDVLGPLTDVIRSTAMPVALLDGLIEARRWDVYKDPFADVGAFEAHLDETTGSLMWLSARALGAESQAEPVVRDFAFGAGLASWLRAVPELEARGRLPLVDGRPEAVAALARLGLSRIARAHANRRLVCKAAAPALWAGWQARSVLGLAAANPSRVADDALVVSEFARRFGLLWRVFTGRW